LAKELRHTLYYYFFQTMQLNLADLDSLQPPGFFALEGETEYDCPLNLDDLRSIILDGVSSPDSFATKKKR